MKKQNNKKRTTWLQFLREIFKTDHDIEKCQEFMGSHLQLKNFTVRLGEKYKLPHKVIVMAENETDAIIKALKDSGIKKIFGNHIPWFRDAEEC